MKRVITENWTPLLMEWYDKNKRELPWRTESPRDPYKVWVSEIMLQQTRVEAVKAYYTKWMEHFPDLSALAVAGEEEVVRLWQGLGYYSRARNLHAAVREVMETYGGHVPKTREEICKLKGIGDYTAGAILSMAYGKQETAVDGNVLRVFARIYSFEENILTAKVKKQITELVKARQDTERPGDFNEALMDLGATVCIPGQPRCELCPVSEACRAKAAGKEALIPVRITKKEVPEEPITVFVIKLNQKNAACLHTRELKNTNANAGSLQKAGTFAEDSGNELRYSKNVYYLLHRRPAKGLLAGMWEFPNCTGEGKQGREALTALLNDMGIIIEKVPRASKKIKHVFSHKIWQLIVYTAVADQSSAAGYIAATKTAMMNNGETRIKERGAGIAERDTENLQAVPELNSHDWRWVPADELSDYNLAGPHNRILHEVIQNIS